MLKKLSKLVWIERWRLGHQVDRIGGGGESEACPKGDTTRSLPFSALSGDYFIVDFCFVLIIDGGTEKSCGMLLHPLCQSQCSSEVFWHRWESWKSPWLCNRRGCGCGAVVRGPGLISRSRKTELFHGTLPLNGQGCKLCSFPILKFLPTMHRTRSQRSICQHQHRGAELPFPEGEPQTSKERLLALINNGDYSAKQLARVDDLVASICCSGLADINAKTFLPSKARPSVLAAFANQWERTRSQPYPTSLAEARRVWDECITTNLPELAAEGVLASKDSDILAR